MSDSRNFRDEESEQNESNIKRDMADDELTEENASFDDLIKPEFDETLGRYREPDDDDIDENEEKTREEEDETDYIKMMQKDKRLKELNDIMITDGDYREEEKLLKEEEEKEANKEEEEERTEDAKYEEISADCFAGDDEETKKTKNIAISTFLRSPKYEIVCEIIDNVLKMILFGKNYIESGATIVSDITYGYLNGRKWDVEIFPEYRKQVLFKFKYNIIPNLLNKYYGKKIEGLSDEEIQEKNFKGESLRKGIKRKLDYKNLSTDEFDIDAKDKKLINEDTENDKYTSSRIHPRAYDSEKEEKENARQIKTIEVLLIRCEMVLNKSDDEEIKQLWEAITSTEDIKKINQQAAEKMNRTVKEIQNIKKRLTRYLRKEIPDINFDTFLKEDIEE